VSLRPLWSLAKRTTIKTLEDQTFDHSSTDCLRLDCVLEEDFEAFSDPTQTEA